MRKISLILNPLYPVLDHNSNLFLKIAPYINAEKEIITLNTSYDNKAHPRNIDGAPVYFAKKHKLLDRLIFHPLKYIVGSLRADDLLCFLKVFFVSLMRKIKNKPDAVISVLEMHFSPLAASRMGKKVKKALYLMDATAPMFKADLSIANENKWFLKMLNRYDVVFTTRFIKEAMLKKGYDKYAKRVVEVSFPMITGFNNISQKSDDKITLLYAGTMYSRLRAPDYFFKIISRLDNRFRVVFIGEGCEGVFEKYGVKTEAEVIGLPRVEYKKMLQIIADSDILINIGNCVPVHIPSKTLEYINTGMPIANFYKIDNCPTLYYTSRYPLCINFDERDENIDKVADEFIRFCLESKDKRLEQEWIFKEYSECTPKEIAKTIEAELFNDQPQ